jgi:hypothetical protein
MKNFPYKEIDELAIKYGSDKSSLHHGYTRYYDFYFSSIKNEVKNILEIGILGGSSIKMWQEYFAAAVVHGVDIDPECKKYENPRTKIYIGDQSDPNFMGVLAKNEKFDIIIDDGSHISEHQIKTFGFLFSSLKDNGIYVIEDSKTSYHRQWVGSHETCVNYFKRIVDDVNMRGRKMGRLICSNRDKLLKMFEKDSNVFTGYEKEIEAVHFYSGLIFVFKQGITI